MEDPALLRDRGEAASEAPSASECRRNEGRLKGTMQRASFRIVSLATTTRGPLQRRGHTRGCPPCDHTAEMQRLHDLLCVSEIDS